jgi:DNA-binding MarR family transcriptional regulator
MADVARHPRNSRRLPVIYDSAELPLRTLVQLLRTYHRMERQLESAVAVHGMSLAQFDLLTTLSLDEGIAQQVLAERMLVTKGNICALLDRLEAGGLVQRRPDPEDRRANRLFLTKAGRAVLVETAPDHLSTVRRAMSTLTPKQQQELCQLLDKLEG